MTPGTPGEQKSGGFRPRLFWQLFIAFAVVTFLAVCGFLVILRVAWNGWGPPHRDRWIPHVRGCDGRLAAHYAQHGSWDGAGAIVTSRFCLHDRDKRGDQVVVLAAVDGTIVASSDEGRLGQMLSEHERDWAESIEVDDRAVGFLLSYSYDDERNPGLAFFWTGSVIVVTGLIVGLLLSRRISRPLVALTRATQAMAAGDLGVRVSVRRRGEIGVLAAAFNKMAGRVEETIVTLRRFVSDAAHEINTPLTALRTNLELAPDDENVKRALTQVERLEALTMGLLDLSRIESGNAAQALESVSLVPLVQEVAELYASRAEQAGLAFDLTLPDDPVAVRGDEAQLQRALGNLLDNAIKFTPAGGKVNLGLQSKEAWAVMWVEDTGIGIPEKDLSQLYSRFHRGRNTAAYPGSGLGLAIVKAIADTHNGTVAVENTENGARFELCLPMA